jgi:hypothetical protein
MNVEIGTEATQFPEKDYIKGIFVAVWLPTMVGGSQCHLGINVGVGMDWVNGPSKGSAPPLSRPQSGSADQLDRVRPGPMHG